ncbi:MAG: ABC transporter permease [Candidatus Tectomicrobia bacterium]|nr:ABC transporter permease [Candidatus Tectomicrobia bacterium]
MEGQLTEAQKEARESARLYSPWRQAWRQLRKNKGAMMGLVVLIFLILMAIFAPFLAPYDPVADAELINSLRPPSLAFLMGADNLGRDVLSRIIFGARISLTVGIVVQTISITLGTTLGLLSGYYGGKVDSAIMGLTNVIYAFPSLLFAIAVMSVLGAGLYNVFIALGFVGWPTVCRLVRAEILSLKEREFVQAAMAAGASDFRLMISHMLPNALGPILVVATLGVAGAILAEASLSFLGLGTQPPTPSWGAMLARGRDYIWSAPWLTVFPGIAIFITILGLNLLGDGLRDALDPRLR